jgi:hypothetical protein
MWFIAHEGRAKADKAHLQSILKRRGVVMKQVANDCFLNVSPGRFPYEGERYCEVDNNKPNSE